MKKTYVQQAREDFGELWDKYNSNDEHTFRILLLAELKKISDHLDWLSLDAREKVVG